MINTKILSLLKTHNVNECHAVAYLYSLYRYDKNIDWIPIEARSQVKLLGIVSINAGLPTFNIPLFEGEVSQQHPILALSDTDIASFVVNKFIPLFPLPSVTGLTYSVTGNTDQCKVRMKKFIKDFNKLFNLKYSQAEIFNIILQATGDYLNERQALGWGFTKKNVKFIYDDNGSELENRVRAILNDERSHYSQMALFSKEL